MTYERQVGDALRQIFFDVLDQVRVPSGIIDFLFATAHPVIVEVKLTQTEEAYHQLQRYAAHFPQPAVRVVVTKTVIRTVRTPERPTYLRNLASLREVEPGYYVIPFTGSR